MREYVYVDVKKVEWSEERTIDLLERQTDRGRQENTETARDKERERERDRQTDRQRQENTGTARDKERETDRQIERQTDTERDGQTDRQTLSFLCFC